ncbi:MAG: ribonuclease III [Terriglobales bacterium]
MPEASAELQRRLGYTFSDPAWLRHALTHRSWSAAKSECSPAGADNERLEFLGDAVLQMRVSERLLQALPGAPEGELTRRRAALVSAKALAQVAPELGLGEFLLLSPAEAALGGRGKPRLLANALEAVFAAIFLDGGYAAAAAVIDRLLVEPYLLPSAAAAATPFGFKSTLQEWAHAHAQPLPEYRLVEATGPEHDKRFLVEVRLANGTAGSGRGRSKKEAEQAAAAAALETLR